MHEIGLLVSVRSVLEAQTALAGGAALIDVKEPARGPLGRADDAVIRAVVAAVAGRRPVSAALGEWADGAGDLPDADLTYVKWGLAGCQRRADWRWNLRTLLGRQVRPQIVLAAYADWQCAQAPSVDEVLALAQEQPGSVMLVDTCCKDAATAHRQRPNLLDWLPVAWLEDLCERCRQARVKIALAGSLGLPQIAALRDARPDWFAVRGAVCADGDRCATVNADKVRQLVDLLRAAP
jgi:uncharacterized protein (UPF0264 family)